MNKKHDTRFSMSIAYLTALSLVACLATARTIIEHRTIIRQITSANIVNTAGRQRMRSQRIAWLVNIYDEATPERQKSLRQEILNTAQSLSDSNRDLTTGKYKLEPYEPMAKEIYSAYNAPNKHLDKDIKSFVADTVRFIDVKTPPAEHTALVKKIDDLAFRPLLEKLDDVVNLYQKNSNIEAQKLENLSIFSYGGVLLVLLGEAFFIFRPMINKVLEQQKELVLQASTDPLTGSFNRRTFFDMGKTLLANAQRQKMKMGVLGLDIDHFKAINDIHGHACGDAALKTFVTVISQALRQGDVMGRIGGEEFSVLLPGVDEEQAILVGNKLRKALEDTRFEFEGKHIPMTVSIGAAIMQPEDDHPSLLLQRADKALYAAKESGRNRVVGYSRLDAAGQV